MGFLAAFGLLAMGAVMGVVGIIALMIFLWEKQ